MNLWEHLNETSWIIIIIGAFIGSMKANLINREQQTTCSRIINIILGIYCGIAVAEHYSNNLTYWLSGLLALTTAMLSVSILETIYELTPSITKSVVKWYTKVNKGS